jgi:hypothetical protein
MCDLYLGAPNSRTSTPPNPVWENPSIISSTYTFVENTTYSLTVQLQNHDTVAGCAGAEVDLYWTDPTTGFVLQAANLIGATAGSIGTATAIPPADASSNFAFTWTPGSDAAGTNGGHVCLAAIAGCNSADCGEVVPYRTPPNQTPDLSNVQVAIHNVQVNMPAPGAPPPPSGGGHGHGPPPPAMSPGSGPFFFGATNSGQVAGITRITARAYDPANASDRYNLVQLASLPSVVAAFGPKAKFGVPEQVHLGLGPEALLLRQDGKGGGRLGFTGPVSQEFAKDLVRGRWNKGAGRKGSTQEIDLLPYQVQQVGVSVVPGHEDATLYAVHIAHELLVKGKKPLYIGGLTVIFVAPNKPG